MANPTAAAGARPVVGKAIRFLLVGGTCTLVQYVILVALVRGAGFNPTVASTIGYTLSCILNYGLSHSFTFKSNSTHRRAVPRFVFVVACALVLNAAAIYGLTALGVHYLLAQVIATGLTLLWNFSASLRWIF
jgi:putative flippase GtrA